MVAAVAGAFAMTSCYTGQDVPDCDAANARIIFRYYPTATEEKLLQAEASMTHLLFRNDVLEGILTIDGTTVTGQGMLGDANATQAQTIRQLTLKLEDGDYTLMTWGNLTNGVSQFTPLVLGQTLRADIELTQVNASPHAAGAFHNSERLYFGTVSFAVTEGTMVQKIVDMDCAHTQLNINVVWKNTNERPNMSQPIWMELGGIPVLYNQAVDHTLQTALGGTPQYGDATYLEPVPVIAALRAMHTSDVNVVSASEIATTFITYRLTDADHPMLSIQGGTDGELLSAIDLQTFFQNNAWVMDNNRRQYFDILIEINGPVITVSTTNVNDWVDGGTIGQ